MANWLRRIDECLKMATRPTELKRPLHRIFPLHAKATTKPCSGWICENMWHHTETIGLLTVLSRAFGKTEHMAVLGQGRAFNLNLLSRFEAWRQIWLRLGSATCYALRIWQDVSCTQDEEDANPGTLARINQQIRQELTCYIADIKVAATLMQKYFPASCLSSNLHAAVCRMEKEIEMHGAPRPELGIERTVRAELSLVACVLIADGMLMLRLPM